MKSVALSALLLGVFASCPRAESPSLLPTELAPHPDSLFAPLRGDPRELHFALRLAIPDKQRPLAEVAVGHYYGIYRWSLPGGGVGNMQLNIGGGIFPLFGFSDNKDLKVIDFYGNLPIDIRVGKWSGRFMFYHVSSHLGDDYIRTSGQTTTQNSWNSLRSIVSCDAHRYLRLYGGYTYHLLAYPAEQKHNAFQAGAEAYSKVFAEGRAQAYWANDLQWWERSNWNTIFNSQLGVKVGQDAVKGRGLSYFLEFTTGPQYYGQFFRDQETRIGLGVKFDIS